MINASVQIRGRRIFYRKETLRGIKGKMDKNTQRFLDKESFLEQRLSKEALRDGIAYIPCHAESMEDIFSRYSTGDFVSLNSDFTDYVTSFMDYIPAKYPVVLQIHGSGFSEEDKKLITDTIAAEGDSELGRIIWENRHHRKVCLGMIIGTVISGILLGLIGKYLDDVPQEFFYVVFWLFADEFVRYVFIESRDYRRERIGAGRLASMKVEFVED